MTRAHGTSTTYDGTDAVPLAYDYDMPSMPPEPFVNSNTNSFEGLIIFVYPDVFDVDPLKLKSRAIMLPADATIDTVNEHVLCVLVGDLLTAAHSCDTIDPDLCDQHNFNFLLPAHLGAIDISGARLIRHIVSLIVWSCSNEISVSLRLVSG